MIGIISDTHDNIEAIKRAVELLNSEGVSIVIHAGDIISPFTIREFKELRARLYAVFGNNDGEKEGLKKKFSEINAEIQEILRIEYKDKKICVYHGTYEEIVDALIRSGNYDIVIRGHTHKLDIRNFSGVLMINPGEVCGYLTGKMTLVLLDVENMRTKVCEI
ncbi:MAG: YfcE family phosphodiesterase [Candidatus Altiarchaeales archaeon]|nr:MAG: YfcE family phosphodiesterase [Candidatus Altiarchaeales archaeon]RLI93788.1 MAG: YfcE family phosphodiesterase [Candidatus Altiarchaeales archaeon]RLI94164.1 MAG: YfcE family phosphodiesterase [Candidatus Altiarchaeales archaeon]HDO82474.1 metallophosphoesterase [Candidatus Altiarchaeales archaeon]HEX55123.1 metallophosphoesterase [Candidatus Altiarchaeales archaeon]